MTFSGQEPVNCRVNSYYSLSEGIEFKFEDLAIGKQF